MASGTLLQVCGLLMHYSCVARALPGQPQPCHRCAAETGREAGLPLDPPAEWTIPFPSGSSPTDGEARAADYKSAKDWFQRSLKPALVGSRAVEVEYGRLPPPAPAEGDLEIPDTGERCARTIPVRSPIERVPPRGSCARE